MEATQTKVQRLAYIWLCLSPSVQDSTAHYLYDPNLYTCALEELEHLLGNPYLVALAHLKVIEYLPTVKEVNPEAM